jgi:hypothetical protein
MKLASDIPDDSAHKLEGVYPNLLSRVDTFIKSEDSITKMAEKCLDSAIVVAANKVVVVYHCKITGESRTALIELPTAWGEGEVKWDMVN